jgi:zinc protease
MRWTDGVVKRVLPNGLTVLVCRDASAPVVAVVTHVRAGYFDEPDAWVGISHVLEHMYFKGSTTRQPGAVARETQLLGGYINAATIYDKTVYYTVLPTAGGGLERAVAIQADALTDAALNPDELARELEVIIQEAKRKLDSPGAVTLETLFATLFRVHRIRRWRIGTEEGLRRLTRDDVVSYYRTRYTPDRVIVAIVGDVEVEDAHDLAASTYGSWRRPAASFEGSPGEPPGTIAAARALEGDVERPVAAIGWRTVGPLHPDAPALDVAADLLGTGRGSRLYRLLRLPGIANAASADHYTPGDVGAFVLQLEAVPDRIDRGVEEALAVAGTLRRGVADGELERVRALIATGWARRMETTEGRATALCDAEAFGGYELLDEFYARALAVTPDDVSSVAERYLTLDAACAVVYLPRGVPTRFGQEWPPAVTTPREIETPLVRTPASPAAAARPAPGFVSYPWGVGGRHARAYDLLARRRPGTGLVTVGLHYLGLPVMETAENAGISWLLARASLRGAGELRADALAVSAERLGGSISMAVSRESLGWWITVRREVLREAAALLHLVANDPTLAPGDVEVERALQASDASRRRDDMFRHPIERVLGQAFPDHPYGLPTLGEPQSVERLDHAAVVEWSRRLRGTKPTAVAVGDLGVGDMLEAMEAALADRVSAQEPVQPEEPRWRPGRASDARDKKQTAIVMAFPSAGIGSAHRHPAVVLGALLSGLAGRLFDELRERRSLAYSVAAMPWMARRAGAMITYIATSPDREDEAREAMLTELARIEREPPSDAELERARRYAAGSVDIREQSHRAVAGEILEAWTYGLMDELGTAPERIRAVTRQSVLDVAREAFDRERRAEYVVRGASA